MRLPALAFLLLTAACSTAPPKPPTLAELPDINTDDGARRHQAAVLRRVRRPRTGVEGRRPDRGVPDRTVEGRAGRARAILTAPRSRTCRSSASRRETSRRSSSSAAARRTSFKHHEQVVAFSQHVADAAASRTPSWCSPAMASRRPSSTGTTSRASTSRARRSIVLVNDPPVADGWRLDEDVRRQRR